MLTPHKLVWHVMTLLYKPHLALTLLYPSVQGPKMCFAEQRLLSDISEAAIAAHATGTSWIGPIGMCEGREPIWERSGHCLKKILHFREKGVFACEETQSLETEHEDDKWRWRSAKCMAGWTILDFWFKLWLVTHEVLSDVNISFWRFGGNALQKITTKIQYAFPWLVLAKYCKSCVQVEMGWLCVCGGYLVINSQKGIWKFLLGGGDGGYIVYLNNDWCFANRNITFIQHTVAGKFYNASQVPSSRASCPDPVEYGVDWGNGLDILYEAKVVEQIFEINRLSGGPEKCL